MMTKEQALKHFKRYDLKRVKQEFEADGVPDWPARREAWNNFTDYLQKSGHITMRQYESWTHPAICQRCRCKKRLRRRGQRR
jgi:hypothetical protein